MKLEGLVLNVYISEDFKNPKTGEVSKGRPRIQLAEQVDLDNGSHYMQHYDLPCPASQFDFFESNKNEFVSMSINCEITKSGRLSYRLAPGSRVELLK